VSESGRTATVVLVSGGTVLGALPPLALAMPWWPEAADLVAAVKERDGIDITVLRLLRAPSDRQSGGDVAYLAESEVPPVIPLAPWPGDPLAEEPLRQPWARPGGPAALLGWAEDQLAEHGIHPTGAAEQMRSWNLSGIWRLPTSAGPVWLKVVPDFFAHEGAVMDWVGPGTAPLLHAWAAGRVLMAEVRGGANHETRGAALEPMVRLLTDLQERSLGRTDELLAVGVPDRRLAVMQAPVEAVVQERSRALPASERAVLERLVETLPARVAAIDACGVPDALVHGDFHPGNVGGTVHHHRILDWGDSFVGNPLVDELAFTQRLPAQEARTARGWFLSAWRRITPQADPERAADLLRPVLPLLAAVVYDRFCAAIEPDERVYHRHDTVLMLRRATAEATLRP
jgi:hypothetical protein